MSKDLIIGCYTNYDWDKIKFWANSIDACGFKGSKIMIVMNSDKETVQKLLDRGFMVIAFKQNETHYYIESSTIPVHVERFFHIWHTIEQLAEKPRFVITTDVKDVVFQTNPSEWIEENIGYKDIVAGSEALRYENEPWGDQNLKDCFGEYFWAKFKDRCIYNVGTLAGTWDAMKDLSLSIFQMSLNRPVPIVDQATFNFLLWQKPWADKTKFCQMSDGWAAQLGTVLDPNKMEQFQPHWLEEPPIVSIEDGKVVTNAGKEFCIVHQYDRVPGLKEIIEKKYG